MLFVGAHPDDETFAAGATLASLARAGIDVHVVALTRGEAALDHTDVRVPQIWIGGVRTSSPTRADISVPPRRSSKAFRTEVSLRGRTTYGHRSVGWIGRVEPARILTVWWDDPHPDHVAVGVAARELGIEYDVPVSGLPIWAHHWLGSDAMPPLDAIQVLSLEPADREYASTRCGGVPEPGAAGERPVRTGAARLVRPVGRRVRREPLVSSNDAAPVTPDFDALYSDDSDPWQVETSWYERQKLTTLIAALPRARYRLGWEPGCGPGITSRALAARCDRLIATDSSLVAVELARRRCRDLDNVRFEQQSLPSTTGGPESVDLVVAAEFLYYLADLDAALDACGARCRIEGTSPSCTGGTIPTTPIGQVRRCTTPSPTMHAAEERQ